MASAVLDELRRYLEKESGYDALVIHGIVEAVSADGQTREEAAEIAQVYLEGNARALELVGDYFAAVDFDSGLGEEGGGRGEAQDGSCRAMAPLSAQILRTSASAAKGW